MGLAFRDSSAAERGRHLLAALGLVAWLAYTRAYPVLASAHATLPPCPFLAITGHPCPLCGGTRSFAATWRGDLVAAVRLYPLGPALFAATLLGVPLLLWLAARGRTVVWARRFERALWIAGGAVLALSWGTKLLFLGN